MSNRPDSYSDIPPKFQRLASAFRFTGWISFWVQLVLAIFSAVTLASAALTLNSVAPAATVPGAAPQAAPSGSGTGMGLFLAVLALLALFAATYWGFSYVRLARRLRTVKAQARPKRSDVVQSLQIGLVINFIGMLLAILAAQAIVGPLVLKSLNQGFVLFTGRLPQLIGTPDILAVQANTNIIMAHFIGAVATLWLWVMTNRE